MEGGRKRSGRGWSVRQRMLALIVGVMAAGLLAVGLVSYGVQYGSLTERVNRELEQEVSELRQMAQRGPAQDGQPYQDVHDLFFAFLTTAVAGDDEAMMGMIDGEVEIFSGGARTFDVNHPDVVAAAQTVAVEQGRARVTELRSQDTELRMLVADVRLPGETRQARFVVVNDIGTQRDEVRQAERKQRDDARDAEQRQRAADLSRNRERERNLRSIQPIEEKDAPSAHRI